MASVGVRRGAIPDLRVGDLIPIDKYQNYKVLVYNRTRDKYVGYCTPECRKYITQYLEWRTRIGERITDASPLIIKKVDPEDLIQIRNPKRISYSLIDYLIRDLLQKTGIREKQITLEGQQVKKSNRTKLMECHALRKFYETTSRLAGMDSLLIDRCMGHKTGLKDSYTKLNDNQILEGNDKMAGYIAAIDDLTINEENRLKRKVEILEVKKEKIDQLTSTLETVKAMLGI